MDIKNSKLVGFLLKNVLHTDNGCMLFKGAINSSGYGSIRLGDKILSAHRLAYEYFIGPIPEDLHVLHRCNTRACINPAHLYAGTHQQNMADKSAARSVDVRGINNPRASMSEDDVRELRELSKTKGDRELSIKYGLHIKTISKIRRRKLWPHVI